MAKAIEGHDTTLKEVLKKFLHMIPPAILGMGRIYDVRSFGTLAKAITYIGSNSATLYITNEQAITTNTTIPSNISIIVLNGGSFAISTGVTLTINGAFEAGLFQVFSGLGSVVFSNRSIKAAHVSWWDDVGNIADDAPAFRAAVAASTGTLLIPEGTFLFGSAVEIDKPLKIYGTGQSTTNLHRNYSPTADDDGIFNIRDGGSLVSMRDMTLRSLTGQTGGCLLSIVNTNAQAIGQFSFYNMGFTTTGTSTHDYTLYFDGSARTTSPVGIRGIDMVGCSVFGGAISNLLCKSVLKFSFVGGGTYTAGGPSTSSVVFDGVSSVKSESVYFAPAECTCPIDFGYCKFVSVISGVMGAITNSSNAEEIFVAGYSVSVQNNWANAAFLHTSDGLHLPSGSEVRIGASDVILDSAGLQIPSAGKIGNLGSAPNYPIEMQGIITGKAKTGTVTEIGQTGAGYTTTCPDGQVFSFDTQSGKLFWIATGGGAGALVFADYKSTTITLIANPSSEFEASTTPVAGNTGIYKSANDHTVSITNNTGGSVGYVICALGAVTGTVDPA